MININKRLDDKRVKKVLVFDTETTPLKKMEKGEGFDRDQVVFDLGYIIADKKGNKIIKKSYLVDEIFTNTELMKNAYFWSKYPDYLRGIGEGKFIIKKWLDILVELQGFIEKYNITEVYAYNVAFDMEMLGRTNKHLRGRKFGLFDDMSVNCLWGMSAETICQQKTFKRVIRERGILTASKKYLSTNAETVYKYITNNWEFEESHTGIDDVEIEVEILAHCFKQHKKMSKGIIANPFNLAKI
ncbi:MAG: hypothetical protein RR952_06695 [Cetobacterium sp.]